MDSFSKEEILRLLAAARARRESDWLMILVAFLHGLRVSEVLALTPDNIVDGHLDVRRRKGSMRTKQPLFSHENPLLSVRDPLIAFAGKLRKASRLFPISRATFWRRMQH